MGKKLPYPETGPDNFLYYSMREKIEELMDQKSEKPYDQAELIFPNFEIKYFHL